ncbi:ABC transporter substrate-binding protein [Frankia nepalensis]|uniref:ABC transporter substrate-binding protein n=1 Tax=Frankia nepalensis TaxID=1836974 RepID=UPI001EE49E2F|nr:ABC transporter substrate-binding protein [Frankia nepalensis]
MAVPLAVVALLTAACGGDGDSDAPTPAASSPAAVDLLGSANPARGEPVKIGMISDGKYPASDTSVEGRVADATAKWINERRGGLGGRPIQLVKCESLGDPSKSTDCGNRMVEEDVAAVVFGGPAFPEAAWQPLHDADIPTFFYGVSAEKLLGDPENTFVLGDPIFAVVGMPLGLAQENKAKKVTAMVINIPAAVGIYENQAPPLYDAAGIELQLVAIPPDQADMTPQAQRIATDGTGVVFVVGGETFCTAAFNALNSVGYSGLTASITQCLGDATRTAVPGSFLKDMTIGAQAPLGTDDPSYKLFSAVATTYGKDIDLGSGVAIGMFTSMASLREAVEGISPSDLTPTGITAAVKKMPEKDLPGAGGVQFRCNGKANPKLPAVCVRGGLTTLLDGKGMPTTYKPLGQSPIED